MDLGQATAQALCNLVVNGSRADKEEPFMAERLSTQDVALINDLWQDTLVDVFPIQSGGGLVWIGVFRLGRLLLLL